MDRYSSEEPSEEQNSEETVGSRRAGSMLVVARALIMALADNGLIYAWWMDTVVLGGRNGLLATARIYNDVESPADSDTSCEWV